LACSRNDSFFIIIPKFSLEIDSDNNAIIEYNNDTVFVVSEEEFNVNED